ncbi:MAG: hypothetical protein ACR2JW_12410 [Thermomicrobiales bacterium]
MSERRRSGQLTFLGLGLVIALVLALPVGVAAAPTPVAVGASTLFVGNGFAANEDLSFWETGSDGTSMVIPGVQQSDANGGFSKTVSFPSAGQWQVTAYGITSGKQFTGTYSVGDTTSATTAPVSSTTSGALPAGTLSAGIGAAVTFSGTGYTANEKISLWETPPDGTAPTALSGVNADGTGAFSVSVTFPTAGLWQVTAQGNTSGVKTIGSYAVGTTSVINSPSPAASTSTGQGFSSVPPVALGSAVTFSGTGYTANEKISLWETPPDGTAPTALTGTQADGTGTFTATVTFPSVGNWQVTAHGKDSLHEVIGRYTVTSDGTATGSTIPSTAISGTTSTTPVTGTTVNTTTNTTISFMPIGFNSGEIVSVWSTGPDGTVTTLDSAQASSAGRAIITATFGSAGLWQITAQGRTSGHKVIGQYQVADRTTP